MSSSKLFKCNICNKSYEWRKSLTRHLRECHNRDKSYVSPTSMTPSKKPPGTVSEDRVGEKLEFEHPFSMIVAGPSRSGKTHWVIDLLVNMETRIVPTPASITYCYAHWQKKYDYLKENDPSVQFYEGLPSTAHFKTLSNAIVVFDDLMDASMGNQNMMNMFTEKSHHQNISVILMMQNIFHQGSKSRSIQLNTQYMVLFKNARDRQQIKTLARQMYPQKWKNFMEHFEYETSKPFGKVIIDLRPSTGEEHRLVSDNNKVSDLIAKQFEQQQRTLQYTNPNLAQARKVQENMKSILDDPALNDGEKASRYSNLMRDYQIYMSNAEKNHPAVPTPILPIAPIPQLVTVKKSEETPASSYFTPPSSHLMTVKKREETPASIQQFAPQVPAPYFTGYLPTPPDSNFRLARRTPLPTTSSEEDSDESNLRLFVSASDDEMTRFRKQRKGEQKYNLRLKRKKEEHKLR